MNGDPQGGASVTGLVYKTVLLKISGEALCAQEGGFGFDHIAIDRVAEDLARVHASGVRLGLVIGGGNVFRGKNAPRMRRGAADAMGMMATVMNAIAVQDALERQNVPTRVMTAVEMPKVAEPYIGRRAVRHLDKGRVVIFAAGTGNPYFSTDTAAAVRGLEMGAEAIFKATKVPGVFDRDPRKHSDAKLLQALTCKEFVERDIGVMDATAVTLCRDNHLLVRVFEFVPGNVLRVLRGDGLGTTIFPSDSP